MNFQEFASQELKKLHAQTLDRMTIHTMLRFGACAADKSRCPITNIQRRWLTQMLYGPALFVTPRPCSTTSTSKRSTMTKKRRNSNVDQIDYSSRAVYFMDQGGTNCRAYINYDQLRELVLWAIQRGVLSERELARIMSHDL